MGVGLSVCGLEFRICCCFGLGAISGLLTGALDNVYSCFTFKYPKTLC